MAKGFMLFRWTLGGFIRQSIYQAMSLWKLGGYITIIKQCFILRIQGKSMSFSEWRWIIVYLQSMFLAYHERIHSNIFAEEVENRLMKPCSKVKIRITLIYSLSNWLWLLKSLEQVL